MFKLPLVGRGFIIIVLKRINIDQIGLKVHIKFKYGQISE